MAGRFSRSWDIFKTSARVLKQNKILLVFPFLATIAALFIIAGSAAGFVSLEMSGRESADGSVSNAEAVFMFAIYLSLYTVVIFFNSALVASVTRYMEGGEATIGHGLKVAGSRTGTIFGYAFIAATVGVLLWAIERRLGFVGQIVIRLLGAAWTVTTFLVVPILVHRDVGPLDAVKESGALLKKTWGENIIANSGIGLLFSLLYIPLVLFAIATGFSAMFGRPLFGIESASVLFALFLTAVLIFLLLSMIQTAITGIYGAALYRHSSGGGDDGATPEFSPEMLDGAFSVKRDGVLAYAS